MDEQEEVEKAAAEVSPLVLQATQLINQQITITRWRSNLMYDDIPPRIRLLLVYDLSIKPYRAPSPINPPAASCGR